MDTPGDLAGLESAVLQAPVDRSWDAPRALLDDDFVITTAGWLAHPAGRDEWVREAAERHELHEFSILSPPSFRTSRRRSPCGMLGPWWSWCRSSCG